jgi:hypothetical protein
MKAREEEEEEEEEEENETHQMGRMMIIRMNTY